MIFSNLGTIIKAVNFLDTNISMIEKMENKYKLKRKLSSWTLIPFFLLLIITASFMLSKYVNSYLATTLVFLIHVAMIIFYKNKNKKEDRNNEEDKVVFNRRSNLIVIVLWLIMMYFYLINLSLEFYQNPKSIFSHSLLFILMVIYIGYALSYLFIFMLNKILEEKIRSFFENVYLNIEMINEELLKVRLITITKKGDYIVSMDDLNNTEILLNRRHIVKITYFIEERPSTN
ncbi:hypothetical protein HFE03_03345 [Paenibacillus sp. EKM102P]|uniref:hypothetical protein n=1 Tax=unclassified Paenibacillus TaxID=185978 RepID=UPI000FB63C0B|nr:MULTISPECIES: hypothetical protein [unclassified Paenibacillus]KAF6614375.1 hypothetical protein HFE00_25385 [Paenibacillus sp. EKM101P]KAF6624590.1 hypothetical protein HFE03_03345 [Paenibacillus sp. EKM102P]KAF6635631.1 hypothetical protein HFE01_01685 [Paenibacillus sp. EKM10P]KAF6648659.1 hypothetical protein HFE02_09865 [Paenibacillus sp. EKM11P]